MTSQTSATPTLLGAEMLFWSSGPIPDTHDGVASRLVAHVVPAGARVLLAGPEDAGLIGELLDRGADLTCLVRSHADGVELTRQHQGRSGLRVAVGDLARLPIGDGFDAIIALAGIDHMATAEGKDLGWAGSYRLLVDALRWDGILLLAVDNPLGLHRLVELSAWYADRGDTAWTLPGFAEPGRPRSLDQACAVLAADDLRVTASYAAFGRPDRVTALVGTTALTEHGRYVGALESVLAAACERGFAGEELLRDPWPLAGSALAAGALTAIAPAWWLCASRGPEPATMPLPLVMVAGATTEIYDEGGVWMRRAAPQSGVVPAQPVGQPQQVPAGRLLHELLVDGCLRRDLPGLRSRLTAYAGWLRERADETGTLPPAYGRAVPENVVVDDEGGLAVLDPMPGDRCTVEGLLAEGLHRFAVELHTVGYAHPWPSTVGIDSLAVVLGGLTGCDLEAALRTLPAEDPQALPRSIADPGSYQELRETAVRQQEEITRLTARLAWSESVLNSQEWHLKKARQKLDRVNESFSYRLGRLVLLPLRLVKRLVKAMLSRGR